MWSERMVRNLWSLFNLLTFPIFPFIGINMYHNMFNLWEALFDIFVNILRYSVSLFWRIISTKKFDKDRNFVLFTISSSKGHEYCRVFTMDGKDRIRILSDLKKWYRELKGVWRGKRAILCCRYKGKSWAGFVYFC